MQHHQTATFSKTFDFIKQEKISSSAKILYGIIQSLCLNDGYCWASNDYLSEQSGYKKDNVIKLIKKLKIHGWIKTYYSMTRFGCTRRIYINQEKVKHSIAAFELMREEKKKPITEGNPIFHEDFQKIFKSGKIFQEGLGKSSTYNRYKEEITIQGASNTIGDIEVLGKRTSSTALPASSKEQPKAKPSPKPKKPEVKMQTHQTQKPPVHVPPKTPPPTPPPPAPEIKRPAKVIYQCLKDELFDQAEKEWITANYDEHTVKEAIKYVNSIVIKTTRLQALKYGCRNKKGEVKKAQSHADEEQTRKDVNRKYTEKLVEKLPESPHTGIDILAKGIEIYALGAACKSIFISWAEHGFKEQLHSALRKRGWRIRE